MALIAIGGSMVISTTPIILILERLMLTKFKCQRSWSNSNPPSWKMRMILVTSRLCSAVILQMLIWWIRMILPFVNRCSLLCLIFIFQTNWEHWEKTSLLSSESQQKTKPVWPALWISPAIWAWLKLICLSMMLGSEKNWRKTWARKLSSNFKILIQSYCR